MTRFAYKQENHFDEIAHLWPEWSPGEIRVSLNGGRTGTIMSSRNSGANEVHHIFGGVLGNPRWDRLWNMVNVTRYTHEFCERYTADGVILCVYAKRCKGEFDQHEAGRVLGFDVFGWIKNHKPQHHWIEPYWTRLTSKRRLACPQTLRPAGPRKVK